MYSCRTSPTGSGNAFRRSRTLPTSKSYRTGSEVLSPSTAAIDRVRKTRIYAREGVATAWLGDPLAKTLEVYRLEGKRWVLKQSFDAAGHVRVAPFDAVEIELSRWWLED